MTRDAVNRTWWLFDAVGLLHKLGWELGNAIESFKKHDDLSEAAYYAMNACVTAISMVDWVGADLEASQGWLRAAKDLDCELKNRKDLLNYALKNQFFAACHQIGNATKHRVLRPGTYREGYAVRDSVQVGIDGLPWREMGITVPNGEFGMTFVIYYAWKFWEETLGKLGYFPEPREKSEAEESTST